MNDPLRYLKELQLPCLNNTKASAPFCATTNRGFFRAITNGLIFCSVPMIIKFQSTAFEIFREPRSVNQTIKKPSVLTFLCHTNSSELIMFPLPLSRFWSSHYISHIHLSRFLFFSFSSSLTLFILVS